MTYARISVALLAMLSLAACTTYYEVTDPTTNKVYYTTDIDTNKDGSVTLEAEGSGVKVTVQNSEIRELSKEDFKAAAYPTAQPAPAPAQ